LRLVEVNSHRANIHNRREEEDKIYLPAMSSAQKNEQKVPIRLHQSARAMQIHKRGTC
jgi:hypothetical protein